MISARRRISAWVVMDLVVGEPLRAVLERGDAVPLAEALRVVEELLQALEAAHGRGVVHGAVRSGHVMLALDAAPLGTVRLTDFAGAQLWEGSLDLPAELEAPEQRRGALLDHRTDIWGAGTVLRDLLRPGAVQGDEFFRAGERLPRRRGPVADGAAAGDRRGAGDRAGGSAGGAFPERRGHGESAARCDVGAGGAAVAGAGGGVAGEPDACAGRGRRGRSCAGGGRPAGAHRRVVGGDGLARRLAGQAELAAAPFDGAMSCGLPAADPADSREAPLLPRLLAELTAAQAVASGADAIIAQEVPLVAVLPVEIPASVEAVPFGPQAPVAPPLEPQPAPPSLALAAVASPAPDPGDAGEDAAAWVAPSDGAEFLAETLPLRRDGGAGCDRCRRHASADACPRRGQAGGCGGRASR